MERLVRLKQIIGDENSGIKPMIGISKSTVWRYVKNGTFPQPVRMGGRVTCWKESEILTYINSL